MFSIAVTADARAEPVSCADLQFPLFTSVYNICFRGMPAKDLFDKL
jgi:glycerol-3-phosphate dehydrogenase